MNEKCKKIFIVDDDYSFRKAVDRILSTNGYCTVEVSRSIPVIKTIIKEKPDLILLDLHMPKAGGIEIMRTMKRMKINIPVVVISGLLNDLDFRILRDYGVHHFLAKPVDLHTLISKVKEVLSQDVVQMSESW
ncbi:MAG: response regulator [Candidatus Latescibacteria bacterium]|nr:response regulator [Candidatus Latescibacterota bacterium]